MASSPSPSALFERLAATWRLLALRSDPDDIVLELLGRFSLERIYAPATGAGSEGDSYQHLVMGLLAQLNVVFYLQRLTLPAADGSSGVGVGVGVAAGSHTQARGPASSSSPAGWHIGFLVSWEVVIRSVEFVLQVVADGRESLWEAGRPLRDKYLAEFLLSALRLLALHPRPPAHLRARDRRDRFARLQRSLELVFDSYPGPKSFLLHAAMDLASRLHDDPNAIALPSRFRYDLPSLVSELVGLLALYHYFYPFPVLITTHSTPWQTASYPLASRSLWPPTSLPATGYHSSWPSETYPTSS